MNDFPFYIIFAMAIGFHQDFKQKVQKEKKKKVVCSYVVAWQHAAQQPPLTLSLP
jgi:thiamine transporter ThiT